MKRVSDVLRAAMVDAERHGVSLYRIAKQCELDDSIVYRFYHDQCGLALSSVDRLAQFLHLELCSRDESHAAPTSQGRGAGSRGGRLSVLEPPAKRSAKKRAMAEEKRSTKKARATAKKKTAKPTKAKKKPRPK